MSSSPTVEKKRASVDDGFGDDMAAMPARSKNRGFTTAVHKGAAPIDFQRSKKRASTLPANNSKRADLELSDDILKVLKKKTEEMKASRLKSGLFEGVLSKSELEGFYEKELKAFMHGKHMDVMTPAEPRESISFGLSEEEITKQMGCVLSCIKGCKGPKDKSPNQDNYSLSHGKNGYDLFCVMDGHGPNGHFASLRTVQTLPYYIFRSSFFPSQMEKCFEEAFRLCQEDLLAHSLDNNYDVQVSGTTCVACVKKGNELWVAHTGDSRLVVGSENDKLVKFETNDHKPDSESEFKRISESGGEVREFQYDDDFMVYRVFVKGEDYPGLCMSRSLGDDSVKQHGVTCVPEVVKYTPDPGHKPFLIVASDGVWEFLNSDWVVKAVAKKLPTDGYSKCLGKLIKEAKRRWKAEEADYCDDITAIMVDLK